MKVILEDGSPLVMKHDCSVEFVCTIVSFDEEAAMVPTGVYEGEPVQVARYTCPCHKGMGVKKP